ncbi:MAG: hypothetical protein ASUL_02954 [Candidatus Aramenus sulfurataquae]|jgi:hypothetical protein|uniref:lipoate--protein ligase n=1 Tax=Candidatus Aramenus sulfurataquae TaxID=1326980 RepID=W7KPE4_9CREN|nr:MAG: hypothetical protein ASUL_02954 [Candidatus Aramenus sulfurataquae]MCL7344970.1 hypothetical protein [Candidatus Aramenus sulfurataquae]
MICEKIFRSRQGKTVVLRVYSEEGRIEKVEVTGDFFADENDIEYLERSLKELKPAKVEVIGVDVDELLEKVKECIS